MGLGRGHQDPPPIGADGGLGIPGPRYSTLTVTRWTAPLQANAEVTAVNTRPVTTNARHACLGGYGVMAMATGSLPAVMALPGLLVAVLAGVSGALLLPAWSGAP